MSLILPQREKQIFRKGKDSFSIDCQRSSLAGAVSQRACVFCGSRVVLYPIADALHLVHGPIGCAAYTWDIRGALSSGPQLHRLSFSTDLQETEVIYGGEKKLYTCLTELIQHYRPRAAFVYSTCIIGVIGDDIEAVCKKVSREKSLPVIPVHAEGFKGSKKDGYLAASQALFKLVGMGRTDGIGKFSINLLGEFNIAGETWIIKNYFQKIGIEVVATITGDGRVEDIQRSHGAKLNVVQCSGSMLGLARLMQEKYGIPFIQVSYFGIADMASALYRIAEFFSEDPQILKRTQNLVREEVGKIYPQIKWYRQALENKKAGVYVGGGFKAISLIKALRQLGMKVVLVGSQTGSQEDYRLLKELSEAGTIITDDSNPIELSAFILEKGIDLFIGGVKERPIAYKLGVGFCDHNHERKIPLAGFEGMLNFAQEVYATVMSPVWQFMPRKNETDMSAFSGHQ